MKKNRSTQSSNVILFLVAFSLGGVAVYFGQNYFQHKAQQLSERVSQTTKIADNVFHNRKSKAERAILKLKNKLTMNPQAKMKTLALKMDKMFHQNILNSKFLGTTKNGLDFNNGIEITEREDQNYKYLDIGGTGFSKENVQVQIGEGMVNLSGAVKSEKISQGSSFKSISKFKRSFNIPYGVNPDKASFEVANKKLTIKFPKRM